MAQYSNSIAGAIANAIAGANPIAEARSHNTKRRTQRGHPGPDSLTRKPENNPISTRPRLRGRSPRRMPRKKQSLRRRLGHAKKLRAMRLYSVFSAPCQRNPPRWLGRQFRYSESVADSDSAVSQRAPHKFLVSRSKQF